MKYRARTKELGSYSEVLIPLSLISILAGMSLPFMAWVRYNGAYKPAKAIAISRFGDKQPPLTLSEQEEWYSQMNVIIESDGLRKPTREQLLRFIEEYKKRANRD